MGKNYLNTSNLFKYTRFSETSDMSFVENGILFAPMLMLEFSGLMNILNMFTIERETRKTI